MEYKIIYNKCKTEKTPEGRWKECIFKSPKGAKVFHWVILSIVLDIKTS